MDELLSEKYNKELDGILSCYDRIVITGSLYPFCYAQGMTSYLYQQGIRIFDYAKFAEPLREYIRENAEALAQANGIKIEFVRKKNFRKENWIIAVICGTCPSVCAAGTDEKSTRSIIPIPYGMKRARRCIVLQKSLFQHFKRYVTARNEAVSYCAEIASSQRTRALLATTFIKGVGKNLSGHLYYEGSLTDVTELHQAEDALTRHATELDLLYENSITTSMTLEPREKTLAFLQEQSGKHFDPQVVEVFIRFIKEQPASFK